MRLTRTGRKHYHTFRLVAAESTSPRDGRFIEILGHYNPNLPNNDEGHLVLNKERIEHWIGKGAQPSQTVWTLLRKQGINKATARETRKKLSSASA
ncbi:MAG: 30S ribosomal protein S16 [Planctomycetes bacterium]|nr:30S ribosomal protein S16 [Planctomycetota bacterium]